jgi:hypothetical protein
MNGERVFNTGRVQIGINYQPPKEPPYMDRDALKLQRAYLDKPQIDWEGIAIVAMVAAFIVIVSLMLG